MLQSATRRSYVKIRPVRLSHLYSWKQALRPGLLIILAAITFWLSSPSLTEIREWTSVTYQTSNWTGVVLARPLSQEGSSPLASPSTGDNSAVSQQTSSDEGRANSNMVANERSQPNQSPLNVPLQDPTDETPADAQSRQNMAEPNNQGGSSPLDLPPTFTPEPSQVELIPTETPTQLPTAVPTEPATATPEPTATQIEAPIEEEAAPTDVPTDAPTIAPFNEQPVEPSPPDDGQEPANRSADELAASAEDNSSTDNSSTEGTPLAEVDPLALTNSDTVQTLQLVTEAGAAPMNSLFTIESMLLSLLCLVLISINGLGVTALIVTLLYIRSRRDQSYPDRLTKMPTYASAMRVLPRRQFYD